MQIRKALELNKQWGNKPCDHPGFDREYDLGADTGDLVCTKCGEAFTPQEVEEIKRKRNTKKGKK